MPASPYIAKTEIAGAGFINFFLNAGAKHAVVGSVLQSGDSFGRNDVGQGRKVQVEFVSANPTGPLHVGHGRGAAVGDCLCRLLQATGWDVTREFYYNDAGAQIDNLTRSVQCRARGLTPEDAAWPETVIAATTSSTWPKPTWPKKDDAEEARHRCRRPDDAAAIRELQWRICAASRISTCVPST